MSSVAGSVAGLAITVVFTWVLSAMGTGAGRTKDQRWRLRNGVGDRVPWYEEPEEESAAA